jgi:hypothetical protein
MPIVTEDVERLRTPDHLVLKETDTHIFEYLFEELILWGQSVTNL